MGNPRRAHERTRRLHTLSREKLSSDRDLRPGGKRSVDQALGAGDHAGAFDMTAVHQLLQDIVRHLAIPTSVPSEQSATS
jgi:hypothetical protein